MKDKPSSNYLSLEYHNPIYFFHFFTLAIQPLKQCYFPSWLQIHPRWHTLDQRTVFVFNSSLMRMASNGSEFPASTSVNIGSDSISSVYSSPTSLMNHAVCSQIVENPSPDEYTLVMHTTSAQWYVLFKINTFPISATR